MPVTGRRPAGSPAARRAVPVAVAVAVVVALAVVPGSGRRPDAASPPATEAAGTAAGTTSTTSTATSAPSLAPPDTARPPPRSFTLVATGDVLLHEPLVDQARADAAAAGSPGPDFRPLLAGVGPHVREADVAVCHLETPVAEPGGPTSGYPSFNVAPEIVPALVDTGYDACTTASNHTYDRGAAGVDRTLAALDAAGLRHSGSARSPAEAATTTLLPVAGVELALLSYTFGFNGIPAPEGQTWRSNPIDQARILADAARARDEGAEVVVVALHWGDEYQAEPNAQQRALGPALVRSPDIDLLLGHHAHVVQPIEAVGGEWIVYGLGNMVAHHGTPGAANEEGLLVRFTFTEGAGGWRATEAGYAPLLVVKPGPPVRLVDVGAALGAGTADPALAARLQQAWDRTAATVNALGAGAQGLTPVAAMRDRAAVPP